MKDNRELDAFIKNKIEGEEVMPASDAWNQLNEQLDKQGKTKKAPWLRIAAVLALLITGTVSVLLILPENDMSPVAGVRLMPVQKLEKATLPAVPGISMSTSETLAQVALPPVLHQKAHHKTENKSLAENNAVHQVAENSPEEEVSDVSGTAAEVHALQVASNTTETASEQPAANEVLLASAEEHKASRETIRIIYKPTKNKSEVEAEHDGKSLEKAREDVRDFIDDAKSKGENTLQGLRALSSDVLALNVGRLKDKVIGNNKNN